MIFLIMLILSFSAFLLFWLRKKEGFLVVSFLAVAIFIAFGAMIYSMAKSSVGGDQMVLNGRVTGKKQEKVSCSHSYSCMCTTINKVTTCQTCYRHSHDYDWKVYSTVGNVEIDREDSQGKKEPERFAKVVVGEPFSISKPYYNYIKASPHSVFSDYKTLKDFKTPDFPKVYDYYRVKHTIDWDSDFKQGINKVDSLLAQRLSVDSMKAKANVIVVFHSKTGSDVEAFRVKNFGGRINDLIVAVNADNAGRLNAVEVFSWSKNDLVNVKIRDEILDLGEINQNNYQNFVDIIGNNLVRYYQHRDNEEFEYLDANSNMPVWYYFSLIFLLFFEIVILSLFKGEM